MIHVFNCAKEACSLPGKACTACGQVCGNINCEPVKDCCSVLGDSCTNFMERPLSTYVIIKAALGLKELYSCYMSFTDPEIAECKMPDGLGQSVGMQNWLYGQLGFTSLHLLMAPYFQIRLWQKLKADIQQLPQSSPGPVKVPGSTVYESFKFVFLHDIGICLYCFALLLSLIWSYLGQTWIAGGEGCNPGGHPMTACYYGMTFFWVALLYNGSYYLCGCCASSVELRQLPSGPYAPPGQQQMS
eukprot:gnl/TRDRNA2_/TRDRNA2_30764_c0_seq1.p1 gnl/TRDRNA2_/TRDRNA2_30764_c0~~gnl/TRDRNA2_/TRDRNA2_30764_c0_seq1.p1  ORF type:complete len:244 (-),score=31.29 gnl/TRDRNA2_/TRDRNA2_30764_c0_seq1:116-847(-)